MMNKFNKNKEDWKLLKKKNQDGRWIEVHKLYIWETLK